MGSHSDFAIRFEALTGNEPFPWQEAMYQQFISDRDDNIPATCNLPTGLGKTNVITIWLLALVHEVELAKADANRPKRIPRRLVYVVNRRTVVDQTTAEVTKLRKKLTNPDENTDHRRILESLTTTLMGLCALETESPLAISTLRGQFADNREWSIDPTRPAVICGTVDMIGSRLLFSGYGVGFKAKPLHAGFLGQDALIVHDEAHLEPAFQRLLTSIQCEQQGGRLNERHECVDNGKRIADFRPLRVMALSATARVDNEEPPEMPFELTPAEKEPPAKLPEGGEPIHVVWQRLNARKSVYLHESVDDKKLADDVANRALQYKGLDRAILIFVRKVEDVEKVVKKLPKGTFEQLTGTMRGLERDKLVERPVFQRFLPKSNRNDAILPGTGTAYLVCTSAGEVGVDISADHMVCDLSTFDSMAQRFGRVNRFGYRTDTEIHVVHPASFGKEGNANVLDKRRQLTLALLRQLNGDGSPAAINELDSKARSDAFAPPPVISPVSDILCDAWALTTIREKMPGRPSVEPYLHGISDWQPPETRVAWREEVEVLALKYQNEEERIEREPEDRKRLAAFASELLQGYALKQHELLSDRSDRVFKHLQTLAEQYPDAQVWLMDLDDEIEVTTLGEIARQDKDAIAHLTVLLPPFVGGLSALGTLDGDAVDEQANSVEPAEEGQLPSLRSGYKHDIADEWWNEKGERRRLRVWKKDADSDEKTKGMRLVRIVDAKPDAEDGSSDETGRRFWYWFTRPRSADDDPSKTSVHAIKWDHHTEDVTTNARLITAKLPLSEALRAAIVVAAELHDIGKRRDLWQRSIGNPYLPECYAKSGKDAKIGKRWRIRNICPDYRHEFGSLLDILYGSEDSPPPPRFAALSADMKELVLHLIAAHHGYARPHFPLKKTIDLERNRQNAESIAIETPRRFAKLQRKYGRWGLAYLESLLRAADWAASAKPSVRPEQDEYVGVCVEHPPEELIA